MAKRKFDDGGFVQQESHPSGRLLQGSNARSAPRFSGMPGNMGGLGGLQQMLSTARSKFNPPQAQPFGANQGGVEPARSGPINTFPEPGVAPESSNPMAAFRAARAGGAPMKKGGKVDGYAKGGSVKGWGKARGGRAAKIL